MVTAIQSAVGEKVTRIGWISMSVEARDKRVNYLQASAAHKHLIVFDYDRTIAELDVHWEALRRALHRQAAAHGFNSPFRPLWPEMGRCRDESGAALFADLLNTIGRFELEGVTAQQPNEVIVSLVRRLAHDSSGQPPILAVFSANLHATVRAGLEALRLGDAVSSIVGADDVVNWKPHPEGIHRLIAAHGPELDNVLMIGDSAHDAESARRAGIEFLWA